MNGGHSGVTLSELCVKIKRNIWKIEKSCSKANF